MAAQAVQVQPADMIPAPATGQALATTTEAGTILNIIERAARDPAVDIDKMERLIAMQQRVQSRQDQIDYDNAMADAQSGMRAIRADLHNKQTQSDYASYAALDKAVRPIYSANGLALSFGTDEGAPEGCVRVFCIVSHRSGHRERRHLDMPADGKGAKGGDVMTKTHATGAAITYGKRYLLGMIFNLAVGEDNDGNEADGDVEGLASADALRNRDGKLLSAYASNKARDYTSRAIETINLSANPEAVKDWRRGQCKAPKGSNVAPLTWLEYNAPAEFERVKMAFENATGEGW